MAAVLAADGLAKPKSEQCVGRNRLIQTSIDRSFEYGDNLC